MIISKAIDLSAFIYFIVVYVDDVLEEWNRLFMK